VHFSEGVGDGFGGFWRWVGEDQGRGWEEIEEVEYDVMILYRAVVSRDGLEVMLEVQVGCRLALRTRVFRARSGMICGGLSLPLLLLLAHRAYCPSTTVVSLRLARL